MTRSGVVLILAAIAAVFSLGAAAQAETVSISMVPVGNAGNAGDSRYGGYGSVGENYLIGKYEVTAGQYTAFLNAVADTDTYALYNGSMWSDTYGSKIQRTGSAGSYSYSVATDYANRPVNYVSFWDAARFANWLHNGQPTGVQGPGTTEGGAYHDIGNQSAFGRNSGALFFIPTENEWYKAAYHDRNAGLSGSYFDYPTGTNTTPSNVLGSPTDPGNNATYYNGVYTISSPYWRTEVGAHENSESPYGTFDQGGNVLEWNETLVVSSLRGLRGGSFNGLSSFLLASDRGHYYGSTSEYSFFGFRVASVPEPGSLVMCVGIAVMGLLYWRGRHA